MPAAHDDPVDPRLLAGLNALAIDLAAADIDTDPAPLAVDRLRLLTGAIVTAYCEYDRDKRVLRLRRTSADGAVLARLNQILGHVLGQLEMPVPADLYREMVDQGFARLPDLTALTLGAIPRPLGSTLEHVFGIGEKVVMAFRQRGRLIGTASLLMPASAPPLPAAVLEVSSSLVSSALARHQAGDEVNHARQLESIGRLAGGVAHDFNNLLTAIIGNVELVCDDLGPGHPAQDRLHDVLKAADAAAALTAQLLAFGRKQMILPRVVDLRSAVEGAGRQLSRTIGEDVRVTLAPAPDAWRVRVDPVQLQQVIVDLATSARDAMPAGGQISVETANVVLDEAFSRGHEGIAAGRYVRLTVADTGPGIPPEALPHLFEPFFTTKTLGKGSGLGLATVYGAVRQNGGIVDVDSVAGRGTRVHVYLPAVEA